MGRVEVLRLHRAAGAPDRLGGTEKIRWSPLESHAPDPYASTEMSFFHRRCKRCGQSPEPKVAPRITGRAGAAEVEFTNFPYRACTCGRLAKWAFDPASTSRHSSSTATAACRPPAAAVARQGATAAEMRLRDSSRLRCTQPRT